MNDDTTPSNRYGIPEGITEGVRELLHAVREGRAEDVPKLVGTLTDAQRRKCVPVLKRWRKETPDSWRADGHLAVRQALLLAGAGCCTGAAAAAQWLTSGDLWWARPDDPLVVIEAMGDRDPKWLGEVARRLADRRTVAEREYRLIARLVLAAGCEPHTTDGFVVGWWRSIPGRGVTIKESLRANPFLAAVVPRLFEAPEVGSNFQYSWPGDPGWADALAGLAEEGRLSREMLVDGCLSRLLRGGRLGIVKGFLALLTALDLTEDERVARTLTWVRMLPDGHALVAGRAQEVLAELDEAGRVQTEHLVEASRAALFRPEKKIVRTQLTMLDKAMKRDRSRTDELLPVAAEAFGHEEHSLQERALTLVTRHLRYAGDAVLPQLAASARQLAPDLRNRASEAFGDTVTGQEADAPAAEGDHLPPAPRPERLDPALPSPAEVAEEVGALIRDEGGVAQLERTLNSLVVHARADLEGLRRALEPVAGPQQWPMLRGWPAVGVEAVGIVVRAVMGTTSPGHLSAVRKRIMARPCPHMLRSVLVLRAVEIAKRLEGEPLPFLLATPTVSTGAIDPAELVARLAAYERSGIEPGRADLSQALLRLDRDAGPEVRAAAAALTSRAGQWLAVWLMSGGLPDPSVDRNPDPRGCPLVLTRAEAVPGRENLPEPFRSLLAADDHIGDPCWCRVHADSSPHTVAVLPRHREVIAARLLPSFVYGADDDVLGECAPLLPLLAESGGPAGPATHLLMAYGLGARRPEERLSAVDAVLVLAARGQLDADRLGRDIAELTCLGELKSQRVTESFQEAARTGACATSWAVLSAALPGLLAGERPHGLSAVLTVAADCAERSGARGAIPEIDELAARPGSSQLVKQARRIREALQGGS